MVQWTAAVIVFAAIMAGAGYFVFTQTLQGGEMVKVPDVTNKPITEAANLLRERGLDMAVIDAESQVHHPTVPKYYIISQRPAAGQVVRTGHKVQPVVSLGTSYLMAPSLLRMTLSDARAKIKESQFKEGAVARIPDSTPRDTVLGQDPPPDHNVPNQGEISLLVSAGPDEPARYMPDIRGMHVSEAAKVLEDYGVQMIPAEIDAPDAPPDTVLNQNPQPFAMVATGQVVTYDVRAGSTSLPNAQQIAVFRHEMPYSFYDKDVRIDLVDRLGNRSTLQSYPPSYDAFSKANRLAGAKIKIEVSYIEEARVEIYVNNTLIETYYLKNGEDPVRASEQI